MVSRPEPGGMAMAITMTMRAKPIDSRRSRPWRIGCCESARRRQIDRLGWSRSSNLVLAPSLAEHAIAVIRERYADFGRTVAAEKLPEWHGVVLSKEAVRSLMTSASLWIPRRQRAPKIHQPRNRRACLGELIQIPGSEHASFEGRVPEAQAG